MNSKILQCQIGLNLHAWHVHTLPPKSLPIPISVYVIKHACYSELGEGQGEGQYLCKLGTFLTKL